MRECKWKAFALLPIVKLCFCFVLFTNNHVECEYNISIGKISVSADGMFILALCFISPTPKKNWWIIVYIWVLFLIWSVSFLMEMANFDQSCLLKEVFITTYALSSLVFELIYCTVLGVAMYIQFKNYTMLRLQLANEDVL